MSVSTENTTSGPFVGNNSIVTPYVFDFQIGDLVDSVYAIVTDSLGVETTLSNGSGITVTSAPGGGSVTTAVAYDNTHTILLYREVQIDQETEYTPNADFDSESTEAALDKGIMIDQQLLAKVLRSIRVGIAYDELAELTPIINTVIGLNGSGNPTTYTPTELATFLGLPGGGSIVIGQPTVTFADAGERAIAVPAFAGQVGTQRDTSEVYFASGLMAGNWTLSTNVQIFANNAARTAAIPNYIGQLGIQTDASSLHFSTGLLAGNWSNVLPRSGSLTLAQLGNILNYSFVNKVNRLQVTRTGANTISVSGASCFFREQGSDADAYSRETAFSAVGTISSSGAGGLDAGSESPSTWYYIYLITNPSVADPVVLFSLSSSSPTMPSGYNTKMLVGAIYNDSGSNLIELTQRGNDAELFPINIFNNLTGVTSLTSASLAAAIPPSGVNVFKVRGHLGRSVASAADWGMIVARNASGDNPVGGSGRSSAALFNGFSGSVPFELLCTSQSLHYQMQATTANAFRLDITGYTMQLPGVS